MTAKRGNSARRNRRLNLHPTARAIRSALALSATMLALAGSGSVFAAGSCTAPASETVTCNGTFSDDVTTYATVYADLTLVVGTDGTTTVDPADGVNGISSYWGGDAAIINYGDISVSNADGIHMSSGEYATVENYGGIIAGGTTSDVDGIFAWADADSAVVNGGNVIAGVGAGLSYNATGIYAYSWDGSTTVTNTADGSVHGSAGNGTGTGIYAYGWDGATVNNDGFVSGTSFSGTAIGIDAISDGGYAEVNNTGTIEAYSLDGFSIGITASGDDGAYVYNSGSVSTGGAGPAGGIHVDTDTGTATIYSSGDISVTSYGSSAIGASAYGKYADVTNTGTIDVNAYSGGTGINVIAPDGANIDNSGTIDVYVYGVGADAAGIHVQGNGYINISNGGSISVISLGDGSGPVATLAPYSEGANAVGMQAVVHYYSEGGGQGLVQAQLLYGPFDINEVNYGSIYVYAAGNGTGVFANSLGAGSVYIDNSGEVTAYAGVAAAGLWATASGANGDISIYNSGTITVNGGYSGVGINAETVGYAGSIYIDSSGSLDVYGFNGATGIFAATSSTYGDITVNLGDASVYSHNSAAGVNVLAVGDIHVTLTGDVEVGSGVNSSFGVLAHANGPDSDIYIDVADGATLDVSGGFYGVGITATSASVGSVIYIDNAGDMDVYGWSNATGIDALGVAYSVDIHVDNSGSLDVSSGHANATGISVLALGSYGYGIVDNSGHVGAYSEYGSAIGVTTTTGTTSIYTYNSGDIVADGAIHAYGVRVLANAYADVTVDNSGTIYANSVADSAAGILGDTVWGDMNVYNEGAIGATSLNGDAFGIWGPYIGDDFIVENQGTISASSSLDDAYGIFGRGYGLVELTNHGDIEATAGDHAYGAYLYSDGYFGGVKVYNYDSISADADHALGLMAVGWNGALVFVDNEGYVGATSSYYAAGIRERSLSSTSLVNSGTINVYASNEGADVTAAGFNVNTVFGNENIGNFDEIHATANGLGAHALGGLMLDSYGNIYFGNFGAGDISADASATNYATAQGLVAISDFGSVFGSNDGAVSASASSTDSSAWAYGIDIAYAGEFAGVQNGIDGSVSASAVGYGFARAEGVHVNGLFGNVYNEGAISASAASDEEVGASRAYGSLVLGVFASFYQTGDGSVEVYASGRDVLAVGSHQDGSYLGFHNYGTIESSASGYVGLAVGAGLFGYGDFSIYNDGLISATGEGELVTAHGIIASGDNGISLFNYDTITADSQHSAFGVDADTDASFFVYNSGTISAHGGDASVAIQSLGASADRIENYGRIDGALWLGDGDDYFYNDGVWNPGQTPSDFGDGDDEIMNVGTIHMVNSTIDLGYHDVNGNYFYNYGTINVSGDENYINMGHGPYAPLVPSLNPNPFYNGIGGVIDFQDGAPDDMLTIIGDFAGDGDINVDVSGLDGVSDILYIDGSVVTGTAGVINVDLLDLPDTIEALIPIVYVTGNSVDGNFVLGEVNWDDINTFVTLDFDIISDIDASNATPDVFNLGIQVTGLSDPGTLAASIPGAVQSLMNSSVGTWRQRMGVIDHYNDGAFALWARIWTDKGGWHPEHKATNFGNGGNFDWDQKNSGFEAGVDFAVTDEFSIGLLVGKSQADVDLDDPGVGSADLDADTWGIYGTWISPTGFYLDASYRWMSFDADLTSVAGPMQENGDAESFNIEVGYAWTLSGGLKIEPQFQYTKTSVDNLDALVTTTGMVFENDGGDSSRGRLGVAFRKSFGEADTGWMWTPYVTISAVREFDGENLYAINNTFFGETDMEGTSTLLELGFTATHQNWSIYGGLNWQDGGAVNNWFGGQLGVRYTFGGPAPVAPPPPPPPAKTCADLDDDGDGINNCDDKCVTPSGEAVGPDGCPVPPPPEPAPEPKPYRG